MKVRSFMLVTGQELIAELVSETYTTYEIRNPLVAHMMNDGAGGVRLGFAPWSLLHRSNELVTLYQAALLSAPVELETAVENSYIEQQTGLILPPASGPQILKG